jgi:hypothetical protein
VPVTWAFGEGGGCDVTRQQSGEFESVTMPELRGVRGPVRVTLLGVPAVRAIRGGVVQPVAEVGTDDGEGGVDAVPLVLFIHVRAMFACGSYVMKLKEYLPRLIYQCQGCQRKLAEGPGEAHRFEFEASSLDQPTFRVRLDAPAVACPGCGRHNVLWSDEMAAQIEGALAEALSALPPSEGPAEPGTAPDRGGTG